MRYILVLDFGTGAGRAVLFDEAGRAAGAAYHEWSYRTPPEAGPGGAAFDPEAFWGTLCRAALAALAEAGARPEEVVAVTATSQRQGNVFVDRAGRALLAVPNRDARARAELATLALPPAQIYAATAHWPAPIFAPLRLAWLRRNDPQRAVRVARILMIDAWLVYRLSGELIAEPSSAAESLLLDYRTARWDAALAEALGVPRAYLPRLVPSGTVVGRLQPAAAADLGLRRGIAVTAGGGDSQCGTLGSGGLDPGAVVVVAGTTAPVQMVLDAPVADPRGRTWTAPHVLPGRWTLESNAGGTGIALRWLRDGLYPDLVGTPDAYDRLCAEAAAIPPGALGVTATVGAAVFDASRPRRGPRGFLFEGPAAQAGAPLRAALARALLEANACGIRANAEQLVEVAGRDFDEITVCGGSARSRLWLGMLAAVLRRPVRAAAASEATALGAAILAAAGVGLYPDIRAAARAMVRRTEPVEASDAEQAAYEAIYRRWRRAYDALGEMPA